MKKRNSENTFPALIAEILTSEKTGPNRLGYLGQKFSGRDALLFKAYYGVGPEEMLTRISQSDTKSVTEDIQKLVSFNRSYICHPALHRHIIAAEIDDDSRFFKVIAAAMMRKDQFNKKSPRKHKKTISVLKIMALKGAQDENALVEWVRAIQDEVCVLLPKDHVTYTLWTNEVELRRFIKKYKSLIF